METRGGRLQCKSVVIECQIDKKQTCDYYSGWLDLTEFRITLEINNGRDYEEFLGQVN